MYDAQADRTAFLAWQAGDREAAARLLDRHYDAVARFFANKAGAHGEDLVQRTFLGVLESASQFRGEGSFRAFLFGIARNVLFEFIRSRVRDGRSPPDFSVSSILDVSPGLVTQAAQRAERQQLLLALQQLPLELQLLLELYYWEELPVGELAQLFEVPPGTIKSRLHRARGRIKEHLDAAELARLPEPT